MAGVLLLFELLITSTMAIQLVEGEKVANQKKNFYFRHCCIVIKICFHMKREKANIHGSICRDPVLSCTPGQDHEWETLKIHANKFSTYLLTVLNHINMWFLQNVKYVFT